MSIISIPRRADSPRRSGQRAPLRPVATPASTRVAPARAPRVSPLVKSVSVILLAAVVSMVGVMENAARQVRLHTLQLELAAAQSAYATQVGAVSNLSAPNVVASHASSLHLVDPVTVSQVPSTSLAATLPLPKFLDSAPVTPRTSR